MVLRSRSRKNLIWLFSVAARARPSLRGRLLAKASVSQLSIASILAALALILRAFRARTLSIVRKLWTTFAEAKNLALLTTASQLRCRRPRPQAQDGCWSERDVYGELPEDGRRVHFGLRAVDCSENCGGRASRWEHSSTPRYECDRQHRHTGLIGTNSWPCR